MSNIRNIIREIIKEENLINEFYENEVVSLSEQYKKSLNEEKSYEGAGVTKWDKSKIKYTKTILNQDPIKFKYELKILKTIEDNDGKVSDKQKELIMKAMRGDGGNKGYSTKH